jgi:hypothetical protein
MLSSACKVADVDVDEVGPFLSPTSHKNALPSILICLLCWEEDLNASLTAAVALSAFSHRSCRRCLDGWIEREESSGKTTGPTCPFCCLVIGNKDIMTILDQPFQPREMVAHDNDEIDEFTLHYANKYTVSCADG